MSSSTKNPRRFPLLAILTGIFIVFTIAALIAYPKVKQRWETPLGPALELPTHTPTRLLPTATQTATLVAVMTTSATAQDAKEFPLKKQ